jgi:hypothetical protein
MFPHQNHVCISFCLQLMPHALPINSHLTWVPNIWQAVQLVKLLIIHFSSISSYFCTLNCKNLHWCHILLHFYVLPCVYLWDQVSLSCIHVHVHTMGGLVQNCRFVLIFLPSCLSDRNTKDSPELCQEFPALNLLLISWWI